MTCVRSGDQTYTGIGNGTPADSMGPKDFLVGKL